MYILKKPFASNDTADGGESELLDVLYYKCRPRLSHNPLWMAGNPVHHVVAVPEPAYAKLCGNS
jgi:hypothetical protein